MMTGWKHGLLAAAFGAGLVGIAGTAEAAPAGAAANGVAAAERIAAGGVPVEFARWRGRRGYGRAYGYRRGYGYGRPYGYGYRRRSSGAAIGAGVAGLAAGAILGSALAAQAASPPVAAGPGPSQDWIAYCSSKYRSFDPASGTYLGYDGERHACQ